MKWGLAMTATGMSAVATGPSCVQALPGVVVGDEGIFCASELDRWVKQTCRMWWTAVSAVSGDEVHVERFPRWFALMGNSKAMCWEASTTPGQSMYPDARSLGTVISFKE